MADVNDYETEGKWVDALVYHGGAVKALGNGRVGGHLVRFTSPDERDLDGEWFDAHTDFALLPGAASAVYYHHGLDAKLGQRVLGSGPLTLDDAGVWIEAQLELRDEYERAVYSLAEKGKLGWSSGTAPHLVEVKEGYIVRWPLGLDASLTPTPADPGNRALPLKAWAKAADVQTLLEAEPGEGTTGSVTIQAGTVHVHITNQKATETPTNTEAMKMDENKDTPQPVDVAAIAREAASEAVKELRRFWEAEPAVKTPGAVVTEDRADRALKGNPFKSFGEMAMAVVHARKNKDERLLPLQGLDGYQIPDALLRPAVKAPTGIGEGFGSSGGFLVGTDRSGSLEPRNWGEGGILARISLDTISANSNGMTYYAENETTRVAGGRHGGVRGYWVSEGTAKTPSTPAFRAMELRLKKACALVYATDELLADAQALQGYLMRVYPSELTFLVENAIIAGTGAGMPQGILLSPALVTVAIVAGQANTTVVAQNVINMWARRWVGVSDYVWLINQDVTPQLMQMSLPVGAAGGQLVYMPPGGVSGAPYGSIFGRPVIEIEHCPTLGTLGDILLVSLSQYQGIQKGGVESASSIHFLFDHDETTFRFVYRFDGQGLWNSAVTPASGSANTVSPFIALAGRP